MQPSWQASCAEDQQYQCWPERGCYTCNSLQLSLQASNNTNLWYVSPTTNWEEFEFLMAHKHKEQQEQRNTESEKKQEFIYSLFSLGFWSYIWSFRFWVTSDLFVSWVTSVVCRVTFLFLELHLILPPFESSVHIFFIYWFYNTLR